MSRVILVAPFVKGDLFSHRWVTPSLGLWRIASFLRVNGHECEVFDCSAPDGKKFEDVLKEKIWDVIGFSDLEATLEYTIPNIEIAKKLCPSALLVAGGSGPALRYQFYLDNTSVDMVMLAEGEHPFLDLCNGKSWQDIEGIVFKKKARVLTKEDYWDISKDLDVKSMALDKFWNKTASFYDTPDYNEINTFRLFTSNYCNMGCKFCTLTLWKKYASGCTVPYIALNSEQVLHLVHRVVDAYKNVKQIFFVDDDFFLDKKRGLEFCEDVIKEKRQGKLPAELKFICLTNINRIDSKNIVKIAEAGFRVLSIGVESTCQNVLDSYNKKQTVEKIWENTRLILDAGIKPYYTLIMFSPQGTLDDLLEDVKGFRKLSKMGAGLSLEPYLIPLPGTPYWEEMIPQSMRWVDLGNGSRIKKGFAWLPIDPEVREVFDCFESFYPKYKNYRFKNDGVKHREKNYVAGLILDALEIVLKAEFGINTSSKIQERKEVNALYRKISALEEVTLDIVGEFTETVGGM